VHLVGVFIQVIITMYGTMNLKNTVLFECLVEYIRVSRFGVDCRQVFSQL